jgi:hypothetical protein
MGRFFIVSGHTNTALELAIGYNTSIVQSVIDLTSSGSGTQLNINESGGLVNIGSGGAQFVNSITSYMPATFNYYKGPVTVTTTPVVQVLVH